MESFITNRMEQDHIGRTEGLVYKCRTNTCETAQRTLVSLFCPGELSDWLILVFIFNHPPSPPSTTTTYNPTY